MTRWLATRGLHREVPMAQAGVPILTRLSKDDIEGIAQKLRPLVGEKSVSLTEAVRSQYGQDEGPDKGLMPDIVVFAESTEHVSEVRVS